MTTQFTKAVEVMALIFASPDLDEPQSLLAMTVIETTYYLCLKSPCNMLQYENGLICYVFIVLLWWAIVMSPDSITFL